LYVRDDWQAVVGRAVAASDLVVFRIGPTEGFWGRFACGCRP